MTETAERLKGALAQLPVRERAELARFLIQSLDDETDHDAQSAWETELTRRYEEIQSGQVVGVPADQVFKKLREKYS